MKKKYTINFQESPAPIIEPITKFGGQPVWIEKPEWPVSRSTGKPMMFICQIALDEEFFGKTESRMAYIFMTGDEDGYADCTWEADGGENAVIIQPGGNNPPTAGAAIGQSLSVWKVPPDSLADKLKGLFTGKKRKKREPFPCEFAVGASAIIPETKTSREEGNFENKIGGTPRFLQGKEFPDGNKNDWKLLLQLDSSSVPFEINFGDAGIGYAFISNDGKTGKFLWQCA